MKNIQRRPILKAIVANLTIFAFFCCLLWGLGAYNFSYQEHLNTFYYDWQQIVRIVELPGGLCMVIADFLTQFFIFPVAAIMISAAVLTIITLLGARILRFMSGTLAYTPLAMLPAVALAFLHFNVNYMYSGTIAYAFALAVLNILFASNYKLRFVSLQMRLFYCVVATFFLYATATAAATLFCILLILGSLFKAPKNTIFYLICPAIAFLQAWISVHSGMVCDFKHALLPDAYFTPYMAAPPLLGLPWIMIIVAYFIACVLNYYNNYAANKKMALFFVLLAGTCVFAFWGAHKYVHTYNETFKLYNCYLRAGDYESVLADTTTNHQNMPLILNCINLAEALKTSATDIEIVKSPITDHTRPYAYMLLSDIFYAMDEVAQAQRYAFEANEGLNNASPRMLQRLVETNIIFGNYAVAERYLRRLDKTIFYRQWARQHRALLSDEGIAKDTTLSAKRKAVTAAPDQLIYFTHKPYGS